jgi:hypothetical protein
LVLNRIAMSDSANKVRNISLFKRISDKFRYGLVLQALRNKLAKAGLEFTPYYWVQEGLFNIENLLFKGDIADYSVEFLEKDDMKFIGQNARGYSEKEMLTCLENGKSCLGLKLLGEITAFMLINFKECTFEPRTFPLKNNEAYLTDMYTMEQHRGKNLAVLLRYKSYEILKNMGRDKIYSVSEFFNSSAIKYKQKLMAKNLKLILFIRLFHKKSWSFTIKSFK